MVKIKRRTLKVLMPQRGKSDYYSDFERKSMAPGKRISANSKIYWETRKNRSDARGKKI